MMRTVLRPAIPFAAALVVALAGCGSSDSSSAAGGSAGSAGGGGAGAVTIQNFAFKPDPVSIPVGTTVTWTNNDSAVHTAVSDSGQGATFDTGDLPQGKSGMYKFDKAGTFKYHCGKHNYMMGTVTVTG